MRARTRENIHLAAGCLLVLIFTALMSSATSQAATPIHCTTNFGEKAFTVDGDSVAFHDSEKRSGRKISSTHQVASQRTLKGIKKSLYLNGHKHVINIETQNSFDDSKDYLAITSPKGHKMTYPLNCKKQI